MRRIVSPFARQGFVDHTQYDTASTLRLITNRFNLPVLPGLQQRDNALIANGQPPMGDLTAGLDLAPTINSNFTGSWYDPNQSGQGLSVEVLGNDLLAYWYVFDDVGQQAWIVGTGPISGNTAVLTATRALNGNFPPNFREANVLRENWGTLKFTFDNCSSGHMDWTTTVSEFGQGSGSMVLKRLTQPSGTSCQ